MPAEDESDVEACKEDPLINKADLDHQLQQVVEVRRRALMNIEAAQKKQKEYYNTKHSKDKSLYKVGTLVLLRNSRKDLKKGMELHPNWTRTYFIHEVLSKGTVRLQEQKNSQKVLAEQINVTWLKLYFERPPATKQSRVSLNEPQRLSTF